MHLHGISTHMESHVTHVQEVISKILFDDIALVAATDDKFVYTINTIDFEYMP